jgi:hypothetical protein
MLMASNNVRLVPEQLLALREVARGDEKRWIVIADSEKNEMVQPMAFPRRVEGSSWFSTHFLETVLSLRTDFAFCWSRGNAHYQLDSELLTL